MVIAVVLSTRPMKVADVLIALVTKPTRVTPVPGRSVTMPLLEPMLIIVNSNVEPTPSPDIVVKISAAVAVVSDTAAADVTLNSRLEIICAEVKDAVAVSATSVAF